MKKIIILLIVISLLGLGCTTQDATDQGEQVPVNGEDNQSDEDYQPDEDVNGEDNVSEADETELEEYTPQEYRILLKNYNAIPRSLDINRTDTVIWRNEQSDPKRFFTIKSEEGLWDDQKLAFGKTFRYTFNETGQFKAYVPPWNGMNVTITVK
ncbi:cupredoxin domain-containing protein [Methanohalophilus mahii]|uniref:Blue (Type 1) copper domain protein n=1 Tax=Methanohalophilus mahii (strain ATCC 35705 / DSM 5219 / SLP) TaxID=547558 RepID=D5EBV0_METMS|nr:hypothetical protein [Methanohalophilus mahii]ADE36651.1 hypothetical protein Mmah_1145 [Methanohalophilus mahii DSM 5219]